MSKLQVGGAGRARDARARSQRLERRPVDVLAEQMGLARWALQTRDWTRYDPARDTAIRLVLTHRVEDEMRRFRQAATACTGCHDRGEDARDLIDKRLRNAFQRALEDGQSAHDLIVRMHRIPRAATTAALLSGMRRGDGELCITFLLFKDGHTRDDIRAAFGDDPAQIAARLTDRHWADFARPLLAIAPGELRQDMILEARKSLLRTLSDTADR